MFSGALATGFEYQADFKARLAREREEVLERHRTERNMLISQREFGYGNLQSDEELLEHQKKDLINMEKRQRAEEIERNFQRITGFLPNEYC